MILELLDNIDTISQQFVFNGYQALVNAYAPAIYGLVVLCVIIYGYAVILGWVCLSLAETSKRLLTVGFVLLFALNWGTFSTYIYHLLTEAPNEIASILVKAIPHSNYTDVSGINSALDQTLFDGVGFVSALWERGAWNHLFPYVCGLVIWLLVLLLIGIALIELVVAKFGLAILLVISPLAIPMMLFKTTKEIIFDGWLKHLVGFALIPVFVFSALALGLSALASTVDNMQQAIDADKLSIFDIAPYSIFAVVCIGLLVKATHMATSIANGFAIGMAPHLANAANVVRQELRHFKPRDLIPRRNHAPSNPTRGGSVNIPHNPSTITKK